MGEEGLLERNDVPEGCDVEGQDLVVPGIRLQGHDGGVGKTSSQRDGGCADVATGIHDEAADQAFALGAAGREFIVLQRGQGDQQVRGAAAQRQGDAADLYTKGPPLARQAEQEEAQGTAHAALLDQADGLLEDRQ